MKATRVKKITAVVLVAACAVTMLAIPAQAASAKTNVKKVVRQMEKFEYYLLAAKGAYGKNTKIKLTGRIKAKAATLSVKTKKSDQIYEGIPQGYAAYRLSGKKVKRVGQDLFGKPVLVSDLPQKMKNNFVDVCLKSGKPVVYYLDRGMDTDMVNKKLTIKRRGSGKYTVKHDVYFGYWGFSGGKANYRIIYSLKKNIASKYGYVITSMSIKPL